MQNPLKKKVLDQAQNSPKKLLDHDRDAIRLKHYSYRTEETYVQWIRRYILFRNKRHPNEMGTPEIEAFFTHLAIEGQVSASTQDQALSGLLFIYKHLLKQDLDDRTSTKSSHQIPNQVAETPTRLKDPQSNCENPDRVKQSPTQLKNLRSSLRVLCIDRSSHY